MEPGSACLAQLVEAFSPAILTPEGRLDRAALAQRAFATRQATETLNAITHPAIMALLRQQLEDAADAGYPAAVLDAPTLFEAGADALCDHIVAVTAPAAARLQRIRQRDGLSAEAAQRRMDAQPEESFYCREGVTVLPNTGDREALCAAATALWQQRIAKGWWLVE